MFKTMALAVLIASGAFAAHGRAIGDIANAVIVNNPQRAEFNWKMNCQGCHGVKGEGSQGGAPSMPGVLSKFLEVEGGRAYLASVPGVVNAPLNNEELADVLNWMLLRFSCDDLPSDFHAYGEHELAQYRETSLVTQAHIVRSELLVKIATAQLPMASTDRRKETGAECG